MMRALLHDALNHTMHKIRKCRLFSSAPRRATLESASRKDAPERRRITRPQNAISAIIARALANALGARSHDRAQTHIIMRECRRAACSACGVLCAGAELYNVWTNAHSCAKKYFTFASIMLLIMSRAVKVSRFSGRTTLGEFNARFLPVCFGGRYYVAWVQIRPFVRLCTRAPADWLIVCGRLMVAKVFTPPVRCCGWYFATESLLYKIRNIFFSLSRTENVG